MRSNVSSLSTTLATMLMFNKRKGNRNIDARKEVEMSASPLQDAIRVWGEHATVSKVCDKAEFCVTKL